MPRPYGVVVSHKDDAVDVVGHNDKGIQGGFWEMIG